MDIAAIAAPLASEAMGEGSSPPILPYLPELIFGLIVYALLGIGTDAIVRALERRALRYRT